MPDSSPYDIGSLRINPNKQSQPKTIEPKSKSEVLAVTWGIYQHDAPAEREAAIWFILRGNEAERARHAICESTGERYKEATGSDRDPWNGTYKAVLELEARGINGLAAIVRRYLGGENPSAEVQAHLDQLEA
jgi:hypothetical protein